MGVMSAAMTFGAQVSTIHSLDRTYADRTNNSIRYNSPRVGGARGVLMLGLGENTRFSDGQARGLGLDYESGPLRVAGGYYDSKLGGTAANASQGNIGAQGGAAGSVALRTYSVAATYQWGAARLMAMYSDVRQPLAVATGARSLRSASNKRTQIWDLGLNHALTGTLFLNLNVIADKAEFVAAGSGRVRQYNASLDWFVSKRTDLYANAGYQTASQMLTPGMGEGAPGLDRSQTLMRVGIRHKF
jgi:predicted porin